MTLKKFLEIVWTMVYEEENGNSVHPCEYLSTEEIEDFAKENNIDLEVER